MSRTLVLRRALAALTMAASAVALLAVAPSPAAADDVRAATPAYGWVYANDPSNPSYTPDLTYQHNSSGGTTTITRAEVGVYTLRMVGIGRPGGVAHVTSYGFTLSLCQVESWYPSEGDEIVVVRCFDRYGDPADRSFTASFTKALLGSFSGTMAYAWAGQPTATAPYSPPAAYQYDTAGGKIRVSRQKVGQYTVKVPNINTPNGTIKVTPYGSVAARCEVERWSSDATSTSIRVWCVDHRSDQLDTAFVLSFVRNHNLLAADPLRDGYARADQPLSASYTPNAAYSFNVTGGAIAISRQDVGTYTVSLAGLGGVGGVVHVTSYDDTRNHCQATSWNQSLADPAIELVRVKCFARNGDPADAAFLVQYARTN